MPSVAIVKFIKTKVIFGYHSKNAPNQVSPNSDHKIKSYSCSSSSTKMGKTKKWEKNFWVTYRTTRGLQIRAGFRDYKSVQEILKIGGSFRNFKSGAKRLQIEAEITNRCKKDFKSGRGIEIGAEQRPALNVEGRMLYFYNLLFIWYFNHLSANFTKWSNTCLNRIESIHRGERMRIDLNWWDNFFV